MGESNFAAGPGQLTPEWRTDALRQNGAIDGARVTSYGAKIIGDGGGFMGQLAKLRLTYASSAASRFGAVIR